jgi:dTDP-4-dehydrorhamnose reductase
VNILVFGKDGQLGKAFISLFQKLPLFGNAQVTYLGRSDCDLSNETAVLLKLNAVKPDIIINAAAYTAVDGAETEINMAYAINARAPELMAYYAVQRGATFLHYSTDYVFDGSKDGLYLEGDDLNPLGVYGKSKAAGEIAVENIFSNSSQGQFAIFRTSWIYGEGENFIRMILRLAKEHEELKVVHDQHGVPTSALWLAQLSLDLSLDEHFMIKKFVSGIYHAVPAGETTWYGLACFVTQVAIEAGVPLKVEPGAIKPILTIEYPSSAQRPKNSRMDSAKLRNSLQGSLLGHPSSYNKTQNVPNFPAWEGIVKDYVSRLAVDGLI